MYLPNQRLEKPDKLSQDAHSQTSYPRVQRENTQHKKGRSVGIRGKKEKEGERESSGHCCYPGTTIEADQGNMTR